MLFRMSIVVMCLLPSLSARAAAAADARDWVTDDFYVETVPVSSIRTASDSEDCRARIRRAMCMVGGDVGSTEPRPCLPGGETYAGYFEALHDHFPPALQRMFCSVREIRIERDFAGTAYAGLLRDSSGQPAGAMMGIRKSALDKGLSLEQLVSWKEQLSFGGRTDSYDLTPGLPLVHTRTGAPVNDFLYYVIVHEFGHLFDFANHLNRYADPNCAPASRGRECEMHPESWGALSWVTPHTPKPENEFPHRTGLCFYWCDGHPLRREVIPTLYSGLDRTSFLSAYATTQPWDDFAESLAFHLTSESLGSTYVVDTAQGPLYDLMAKLGSPVFATKRAYLRAFLERSDIRYP